MKYDTNVIKIIITVTLILVILKHFESNYNIRFLLDNDVM